MMVIQQLALYSETKTKQFCERLELVYVGSMGFQLDKVDLFIIMQSSLGVSS